MLFGQYLCDARSVLVECGRNACARGVIPECLHADVLAHCAHKACVTIAKRWAMLGQCWPNAGARADRTLAGCLGNASVVLAQCLQSMRNAGVVPSSGQRHAHARCLYRSACDLPKSPGKDRDPPGAGKQRHGRKGNGGRRGWRGAARVSWGSAPRGALLRRGPLRGARHRGALRPGGPAPRGRPRRENNTEGWRVHPGSLQSACAEAEAGRGTCKSTGENDREEEGPRQGRAPWQGGSCTVHAPTHGTPRPPISLPRPTWLLMACTTACSNHWMSRRTWPS